MPRLLDKSTSLPICWRTLILSSMPELDLAERVARNIRALRAARGITQAQAADAARLPRATWAHLESGAANPTLQVIHRAAGALQVSIEELIAAPRAAVELFKAGSLPSRTRGNVTIRQLLPDPLPGMAIERLELPPRSSFPGVPHTPGTKEYLACAAGEILLAVAGRKFTLAAGDVLAFLGDQKHSYANPGAVPAVGYSAVLLVGGVSGFTPAAAVRGSTPPP
jgi:transcriptional regulator with XRE-family HTH domain